MARATTAGPACLGALLLVAAALAAVVPAADAAGAPQVDATWVSDVNATSAKLHAEVNPEGLDSSYRFEYLTEAAYQANLAAQPARDAFAGAAKAPPGAEPNLGSEEGPQPAVQRLEHLAPGTAYRYRVVATNGAAPAGVAGPVRTLVTQSSAPAAPENCANAQLRIENVSTGLPDCRAWEMVSPVDKNGGAIQGFGGNVGGGVLQVAAAGAAATYSSSSSFGQGAEGAPVASQYLSRRTEAGWTTENVTAPTLSGAFGQHPDGVPFQLFSADLSVGLTLNGRRCGESETCPRGYSLRESATGALIASPEAPDLRFAGSGPDLGHLVLSTCRALTLDATEIPLAGGGCDPAEPNLYEWSGSTPTAVNLLPGETESTPGAALAAQSGAVSADGARVYFTDAGDLYLRDGAQTEQVDAAVGGGGIFQTASADGLLAFFTKGSNLYRYDALTETSALLSGGVQGVLGGSRDGSHLYYLTAAGLFLWNEGAVTEVAAGADAAAASDFPPGVGTARVSPDGAHLAFLSAAELTGYDNADQGTLEPDDEVYLYSAPAGSGGGTLACVSCNPSGERPLGPSSIRGAIANGKEATATRSYKPRNLSSNGNRLFFDSSDRIVPRDGSAAQDVYQWEAQGSGTCQKPGGCLSLISSGRSAEASSFIDASADGSDAFFLTVDSLVPTDPGAVDLYDADIGGGFPVPRPGMPCEGDACQSVPSPPEDPAPGTLVPGSPNPPVHFPKTKKKGKHHKKSKQHKKQHGHRQGGRK